MKGFFEKASTETPYKSAKGVHSCVSCGLYKGVLSPKIEPYGNFKKGIMVLGESPGETEDKRGKPWQGKAGQALQQMYRKLGVDLFEDCICVNAVSCRPTDKNGNRAPTEFEIACCQRRVVKAVKEYAPKVIILHGGVPLSSLIDSKWESGGVGGIGKWRGWTIPDRDYNAWLCPTYHPSYIERQEHQGEVNIIWERDLKKAFQKIDEPLPKWTKEEQAIIIPKPEEVTTILRELNNIESYRGPGKPMLAFDVETTGLKPYNKAVHQIVCISLCNNPDKVYSMPMPTDRKNLHLLKRLLENPAIGKIAANMKYEDTWMNVMCEIEPSPWLFDTMQASHVLDNRPSINGLKFQAYIQFGLIGYDSWVSPYLKSPDANTPNRILELTRDRESFRKLLIYCGIDSLTEYRLAQIQMKELGI